MIKNASVLPKRYYGLHMVEGVAEYAEAGGAPYRILVGETTIKNMDPTFTGRPVYVRHVDDVNLENLQEEADGFVVRSFFNQSDGKHWAEFIIVSDKGHEAIRNKWKLSNAYIPKSFSGGGLWHGVEFAKEVTTGEYEHLAIVPNPRYEESIILTPEEFKNYCGQKEIELERLSNSKDKGENNMKLKFWEKKTLSNAKDLDLESLTVELPKSKKEMTILQVVNDLDAVLNMNGYANGDHMVKVGEDEMSVNDLVKKHMDMCNSVKKNAEEKDKLDNESEEDKAAREKKENDDKEAADKEAKEKKENEDKAAEEKKQNDLKKKENLDKLKNAQDKVKMEVATVSLSDDRLARGKERY